MPRLPLHRQVCAFIDILGGGDFFKGKDRQRAATLFAQLSEFERRLNGWSYHFPQKRYSKSLVKTFSDNILVAFPLRSNPKYSDEQVVLMFLEELKHQLFDLTLHVGFPVRGAATVGPLMFTDKFLFGPALVEAVELEKLALFPRVLISARLLKIIDPNRCVPNLLLKDSDGQVFLDYLSIPFGSRAFLEEHKKYVMKGLDANKGRIRERQKYEWLVRYHNYVAIEAGLSELAVEVDSVAAYTRLGSAAHVAT